MAEKWVNLLLQIFGIKSYSNKIKHVDIISGHIIILFTSIYSSEIVRLFRDRDPIRNRKSIPGLTRMHPRHHSHGWEIPELNAPPSENHGTK